MAFESPARTLVFGLLCASSIFACSGRAPATGTCAPLADCPADGDGGLAQVAPDASSSSPDAASLDAALDAGPADPLDPGYEPPVDTNPGDYDANEWITTAMAKVQPTDPAGADHWALLSAARNEGESFQVHVHAPSALSGVTVAVSDLRDARSGGVIAASSSVTVSRELYLSIPASQVSDANGRSGVVPDALVPAVDPYFHEARSAFPVDVAAGSNVSAWVDVFVPSGTPSGWYTGAVTVSAGGKTLSTMPVRVAVWKVTLPSTASLRSDFGMTWNGACVQAYGSYAACGAAVPSGSPDDAVEYFHQLYAAFALDHRVSIGSVVYAGPTDASPAWTHFDSVYAPLFNGTAKTAWLAGAKLTTVNYAGNYSDTAMLANWIAHFKSQGWQDSLAYYHCDEPAGGSGCTFAAALAEENAVHSVSTDFRTLLTARIEDVQSNGLLASVDVLTPVIDQMQPHGEASHRPLYDSFLAQSAQKRLYWYQSCDEHESCNQAGSPGSKAATWPSYMADASPMRNRVFQWLAYMFQVQGELYYLSDGCFTASCNGASDPLKSIYAYSGNGDGTLFYPGNTSVIGGQHHVPLSSIRLELIREGMEDYELLHALDVAGQATFALAQAASFIQRADTFSDDPATLYAARRALGMKLHALAIAAP